MKLKKLLFATLCLLALVLIFVAPVMAQDVPQAPGADAPVVVVPAAPTPTPDVSFLQPFIQGLAGKYAGIVTTVLIAVGALRLLFKPIFATLHWVVAQTGTTRDDELLDKAESSKAFKTIAFLLDYLGSIKLKK